jgi:hypothetical protein
MQEQQIPEACRTRLIAAKWLDSSGHITPAGDSVVRRALNYGVSALDEALPRNFEIKFFEPQNTLQQDLFLLAKNHYSFDIGHLVATALICALHIRVPLECWEHKSTVFWLHELFVKQNLILSDDDDSKLQRLLLNSGNFPFAHHSFYGTLVCSLLEEVRRIKPSSIDKELKTLVPLPQKDPNMVALLERLAEHLRN